MGSGIGNEEMGLTPTLKVLETESICGLFQRFEHCVIFYKHSTFLDKQDRCLMQADVSVSFDITQKHEFNHKTLESIREQTSLFQDNRLALQLYELLLVELQMNPMNLQIQATLKDFAVRA